MSKKVHSYCFWYSLLLTNNVISPILCIFAIIVGTMMGIECRLGFTCMSLGEWYIGIHLEGRLQMFDMLAAHV